MPKTVDTSVMKKIKGIPYEIVGDVAIAYPEDKEPVTVPLEMGKSAYSALTSALFSKGGSRAKGGAKSIGNFEWNVEDNILTVVAKKDQRVIGTKELLTEPELRYPRNHAVTIVLSTLE